jgi:hypothetical protein
MSTVIKTRFSSATGITEFTENCKGRGINFSLSIPSRLLQISTKECASLNPTQRDAIVKLKIAYPRSLRASVVILPAGISEEPTQER